ncbi:MAG: GLPGLI family protein [Muribaculaceae bacterium]
MKQVILMFFILSIFTASGQLMVGSKGLEPLTPTKRDLLDKSYIECIYSHSVFDPKRDETRELFDILEVGKKYSSYSNYGAYKVDSLIETTYAVKLTRNDFFRISHENDATWECLIKNLNSDSISVYDRVLIDRYVYKEKKPDIKWSLHNETTKICGHICHKATATFRGRNWTVWYSDIPLKNGPWKFGNLPGLILRAEDDKKEHIFEAISIRKGSKRFGPKHFNYIHTTRKKFNEALAEYKTNPGALLAQPGLAIKDMNGNIVKPNNKPKFFNPIELE